MTAGLTPEERDRYTWQMWTPGFGEAGQEKLKAATVFISRIGGVGGTVAMQLAAAGVGRLILAHGGELRCNDLNRQLLMRSTGIGVLRVDQAVERLREINPHVEVVTFAENVSTARAEALVADADIVVSAAPLFEERLAMNAAAVHAGKRIVHCAMYDMEASVLVTEPGRTACLACLTPEAPAWWKREFPVFGSVAGVAGSLAATEVIKCLSGLGQSSTGKLIAMDLANNHLRTVAVARDPGCLVCGGR